MLSRRNSQYNALRRAYNRAQIGSLLHCGIAPACVISDQTVGCGQFVGTNGSAASGAVSVAICQRPNYGNMTMAFKHVLKLDRWYPEHIRSSFQFSDRWCFLEGPTKANQAKQVVIMPASTFSKFVWAKLRTSSCSTLQAKIEKGSL